MLDKKVSIVVAVKEWDLEVDGDTVLLEDAGVYNNQEFIIPLSDVAQKLGVSPDDLAVELTAANKFVLGDDVVEIALDIVSDQTGWCIVNASVFPRIIV